MDKKFLGVYSRSTPNGVKTYYFAWTKNNLYSVQKLDRAFNPVDLLRTIDGMSFQSMFTFEPGMKQIPSARRGVSSKTRLEEILNPENIESTMREQFRKAMVRMRRQNAQESAVLALKNLAEVEEGIVPEHKHMFSDFGAQLRKGNHLEEALAFCKRTLTLSPTDDHAHFNAARVLMDMGNYDDAEQHLLTAQIINPENNVHDKALKHIEYLRVLAAETPQQKQVRHEENAMQERKKIIEDQEEIYIKM